MFLLNFKSFLYFFTLEFEIRFINILRESKARNRRVAKIYLYF